MRVRSKKPLQEIAAKDIFHQVAEVFQFFQSMGLVPVYFFLSAVCTTFSALFNLLGMGLLIPLLRGVIGGNPHVNDRLGLTRFFSQKLPAFFSDNTSWIALLSALILFSFVMKNMLVYFSALSMSQQSRRADRNIRELIVGRCLGFGKQFFDGISVSDVCNVIISGSQTVTGQLQAIHRLFGQLVLMVSYLALMFWISWPLTLFIMIIFPLQHVLTGRLIERVKSNALAVESAHVRLSMKVFNTISCIALVKSYANEDKERESLTHYSDKEIEEEFQAEKKQLLVGPLQDLSKMIGLILVVFAILWVEKGQLTGPHEVSSYLIFFILATRAMPSFAAITNFKMAMARSAGMLERFRYIMNEEKKYRVDEGKQNLDRLENTIEFKQLYFNYRENVPVLRNVSFSIEKGKMTAIVGVTGVGKTTLVHLLMRFYQCPPATIFIDGQDIRDFTLKSVMKRIAFVSQEPLIFNDSLRVNLAYGLETSMSDERLVEALQTAQLGELLDKLPQGLDTRLGDRGVQLSGGERQRLMIARALLKNAEILILDEATSALDTKTERRIQDAIEKTVLGRTTIVIAHRLSTIINADKIVVIEGGSAIEEGPLKALINKRGKFYEFWKAQEHLEKMKSFAENGSLQAEEDVERTIKV